MTKRMTGEFKRQAAKPLRSNTMNAEAFLWRSLRQLDVRGSHFRRQVVIGPYIVDFVCLTQRLIVEVDGSQHGTADGLQNDEARTHWLNREGYRVLRFWNNDVMSRPKSVMDAIYEALDATPPRQPLAGDPPPQGEGEGKLGRGE